MNITLALKHHQLDTHNALMMARIADETTDPQIPIQHAQGITPAGDSRRLRGIPAIGRGVAGAIPGTTPHNVR